jgi:hypothetical protein
MPTLNPYPGDDHYPYPLRSAEADAIRERRTANAIPPDAPVVGFALSGGGIRSATFCLGLFQALARQRLVRRIDVLSTVSGGGYFGSFLGTAFNRDQAGADAVEHELAENHSWTVRWLRENGRFLSPNGAGDNWLTAAVALRNWVALHVVLLTFTFLMLGLGVLIRADLWSLESTREAWTRIEQFFWQLDILGIWWSPWMILPAIPFVAIMLPTGTVYWSTQWLPMMGALGRICGLFSARARAMNRHEFRGRAQHVLTRMFMLGFVLAVVSLGFGLVDSLGQTAYLKWAEASFEFPALWALLTGAGTALFGFGSRVAVYLERILGVRRARVPATTFAFVFAFIWTLLGVLALSVTALGFAWDWDIVWNGIDLRPMTGAWPLSLAVFACFVASWFFSTAFGFVNLSSLQQLYAARLSRAYLGATNPERQRHENHSMTDLMPGDDVGLEAYAPHRQGGPLHLINATVNETISGKTNIERRDRKGVALAVGPAGLSVGIDSHALWADESAPEKRTGPLKLIFEVPRRTVVPLSCAPGRERFHALCDTDQLTPADPAGPRQHIEALPLGRWVAISGAAFTTGTGANTTLGLSLLLGLANVRLGYWWDSGIQPGRSAARSQRPTFLELASRVISRVLPVQSCLMNEFFARFHGAARRHWYLSDGGHFENTGCYELIRRRVPFMVCSDAGQDARFEFADFANLVRKARIDFNAEIQLVRRRADVSRDDPGVRFPMPCLEDLVHPDMLDVIGTPEDFPALERDEAGGGGEAGGAGAPRNGFARSHALLARIHYLDNDTFSWLLLIKPSLMGDEAADVVQYQRTHPFFPHEPTSDQYFDEAQWESYRKLGEHIGTELFTPPARDSADDGPVWTPFQLCAPPLPAARPARSAPAQPFADVRELPAQPLGT